MVTLGDLLRKSTQVRAKMNAELMVNDEVSTFF